MFASQIEVIKSLQQMRGPYLDSMIKLLDLFDRQEFMFILIPVIWLGYSWRGGIKLYYLMSFAHIINVGLKKWFALPRPFHIDPALGLIHVGGYGFPSGAAQTSMLLAGLLVLFSNFRWKWPVAIAYTLLISFSRLYLGVHFPMDIAGGWILGLLLLGMYVFACPKIERFFERRTPSDALIIQLVMLGLLLLLWHSKLVMSIAGCGIGLGLGIFALSKMKPLTPLPKWMLCMQVLMGIAGIFLIHWGIKMIPASHSIIFLEFLIIGLWMSLCTPFLCARAAAYQ